MEINTLRIVVTLISLALFIGLMVWAYSRRRHAAFDEAAQLPFLDSRRGDEEQR
jgi:cytochrome c oxidase cbb3-type subunit IV